MFSNEFEKMTIRGKRRNTSSSESVATMDHCLPSTSSLNIKKPHLKSMDRQRKSEKVIPRKITGKAATDDHVSIEAVTNTTSFRLAPRLNLDPMPPVDSSIEQDLFCFNDIGNRRHLFHRNRGDTLNELSFCEEHEIEYDHTVPFGKGVASIRKKDDEARTFNNSKQDFLSPEGVITHSGIRIDDFLQMILNTIRSGTHEDVYFIAREIYLLKCIKVPSDDYGISLYHSTLIKVYNSIMHYIVNYIKENSTTAIMYAVNCIVKFFSNEVDLSNIGTHNTKDAHLLAKALNALRECELDSVDEKLERAEEDTLLITKARGFVYPDAGNADPMPLENVTKKSLAKGILRAIESCNPRIVTKLLKEAFAKCHANNVNVETYPDPYTSIINSPYQELSKDAFIDLIWNELNYLAASFDRYNENENVCFDDSNTSMSTLVETMQSFYSSTFFTSNNTSKFAITNFTCVYMAYAVGKHSAYSACNNVAARQFAGNIIELDDRCFTYADDHKIHPDSIHKKKKDNKKKNVSDLADSGPSYRDSIDGTYSSISITTSCSSSSEEKEEEEEEVVDYNHRNFVPPRPVDSNEAFLKLKHTLLKKEDTKHLSVAEIVKTTQDAKPVALATLLPKLVALYGSSKSDDGWCLEVIKKYKLKKREEAKKLKKEQKKKNKQLAKEENERKREEKRNMEEEMRIVDEAFHSVNAIPSYIPHSDMSGLIETINGEHEYQGYQTEDTPFRPCSPVSAVYATARSVAEYERAAESGIETTHRPRVAEKEYRVTGVEDKFGLDHMFSFSLKRLLGMLTPPFHFSLRVNDEAKMESGTKAIEFESTKLLGREDLDTFMQSQQNRITMFSTILLRGIMGIENDLEEDDIYCYDGMVLFENEVGVGRLQCENVYYKPGVMAMIKRCMPFPHNFADCMPEWCANLFATTGARHQIGTYSKDSLDRNLPDEINRFMYCKNGPYDFNSCLPCVATPEDVGDTYLDSKNLGFATTDSYNEPVPVYDYRAIRDDITEASDNSFRLDNVSQQYSRIEEINKFKANINNKVRGDSNLANVIIRKITTKNVNKDVDPVNPFLPEGYLSFIDKDTIFKQLRESDKYPHHRFNENETPIDSHMRKHLERQCIIKSRRENHYIVMNAREQRPVTMDSTEEMKMHEASSDDECCDAQGNVKHGHRIHKKNLKMSVNDASKMTRFFFNGSLNTISRNINKFVRVANKLIEIEQA